MCARCSRPPVARASAMSRATATSSASAGAPRSPRMLATRPSCMTPPSTRSGSSAWSTIGRPVTRLYARALRISRALLTMLPSSEKATAPACAMSAISDSSWPFSPRVIVPIGWTRTTPPRRAAVLTHSTSEAVSTVGLVFGMAQMVVKPPAAAARVPDSDRLLVLEAGSRRWQCRSTKPGATTIPSTSTRRSPLATALRRLRSVPLTISSTRPLPTTTSANSSTPWEGSTSRPPISRIRSVTMPVILRPVGPCRPREGTAAPSARRRRW